MAATQEKAKQVTNLAEGEISPMPVSSPPPREAWFWNNPAHVAAARRGLDDAAAGRVSAPQSFAEYADLEIAEE